ncbi:substrate-binding domain-containing protein [Nocardioides sp. LMS-CY]|uniref:Ribose transport system substrate-binding protein n=1 Tax=Nocardioides soli TaxID=1036020 RepID=A0A7W4VXK4_9ACTN|nr:MULTISPECIES: sugar ABC transporter substrate-binding protein [Nocardioides]MBB3043152.1 ribose transport system substrate-binding protein [Nocardioides soli]QWF23225.1 substrate-binding domain-containing protein [Nocardioides sp. LMS-CY]
MNRSTLARGVSALALTAVLATATACSSTEKSGGSAAAADPVSGTVDIAFFGLAANNTYTQSMFKQAEETAQGMDAKVQFFDGKFDASVQSRQVQDAITSGNYDAFIIMPNDSASILPFAQQAIDAGIKVSSLEYPIGKDPASVDLQLDGLTTQVIEDVVFGAESIADSANRACEVYEGCQVAMLWGSRKLPTDAVKVPAFKDDLDPANKLVAEGDANYLEVDGFNLATDMLQANPDINLFVTVGDQMAGGAARAVTESGRTLGNKAGSVTIIGYGATTDGVEAIRAGRWFESLALVPKDMAAKVTELTIAAARGEEPSDDERSIVQNSLSPIGVMASEKSLAENPDFVGQYSTQ